MREVHKKIPLDAGGARKVRGFLQKYGGALISMWNNFTGFEDPFSAVAGWHSRLVPTFWDRTRR